MYYRRAAEQTTLSGKSPKSMRLQGFSRRPFCGEALQTVFLYSELKLFALVLRAQQRSGGGQVLCLISVRLGELPFFIRADGHNFLTLLEAHNADSLSVLGSLGQDCAGVYQKVSARGRDYNKLDIALDMEHRSDGRFVGISFYELLAVRLRLIGGKLDLRRLSVSKKKSI